MRKNIKAILVLCCIMAMVLTGIGIPTASAATVDSLTVSNMFNSLGEATQYGVVAREWDQYAHAETNACVDVMDRYTNTIFSNTGSTYFHALGYRLEAEVTAPANPGLNGMTFALFKESADGTSLVMIDGSQITLNADVSTATLTWDIDGLSREALKDLKNTRLYVRQVKADGTYVDEAGTNDANLVVNYGPSISASAYNTNYIGKMFFQSKMGENDSIGVFNTTGNTPGIIFGADTRAYYKDNATGEFVVIDPEDADLVAQTVYVNYYYGDRDNPQMAYAKLDGMSFANGVFSKSGDPIIISYTDETSRAVLFSLFVIACGLVFLETAANPYMTELGDRETAASRLNLAQSFNGLGCACAPLLVGMMLFSEGQEANLSFPYMMMGIVVLVVALVFSRVQLPEIAHQEDAVQAETAGSKKGVWSNKLFVFGISALFCYEIAEISINSFFINYVVDDGWMNALDAAKLLSVAGLGLFMCGRFIGSWIMRFVRAEKFLLICAIGTVLFTSLVVMNLGMVSFVSLILIYLFEAIMFPTIFAISLRGLGNHTKRASSYLMMTPIGGAVGPLMMGYVGDMTSMSFSFVIPLISYFVVLLYALKVVRIRS